MRHFLKLVLVTLPLAAAGAGILAYMVATSPPPARAPLAERTTPVRVIVARTQAVAPRIVGFGLVSPARTFEAIAQVAGTVDHINPDLKKGAILPAGAELLRLSAADFNLAIAQARANIRAAEARLAELEVSQANQISALKIETEALALKTADLERAETLFANGTIPQTTRDAAQAALLAQRQKVQSVESALALLPTQQAVQIEQIAVDRANLETAELNLARTELTLPFAARVASVSVEVGQFLRSGQTAAVFDSIDAAEVEAQIPIAAMRTLLQSSRTEAGSMAIDPSALTDVLHSLGLTSQVHLRAGNAVLTWPATVARISDAIELTTGTLGVIVRVDKAYSGIEPGERPPLTKGMFVEVSLQGKPLRGIVVPRSALRDGQLLVADADDRLRQVGVTAHLVQDEIAVITQGIAPDTRIVVSAPSPVIDGMLLDVTEDTDLMGRLSAAGQGE